MLQAFETRVRVRSLLVTNWVFFRLGVSSRCGALNSPFLEQSLEEPAASGRLRSTYLGAWCPNPDTDDDSLCGLRQTSYCLRLMHINILQFLFLFFYILCDQLYHRPLRSRVQTLKLVSACYAPL